MWCLIHVRKHKNDYVNENKEPEWGAEVALPDLAKSTNWIIIHGKFI